MLWQTSAASAIVATPAALQTSLRTNAAGAVVDLAGVDPLSAPQLSMTQTFTGGKLIFSDSPESPTNTGMLYKDATLTATASANRIFVYHANGNSAQMRFSVLVKNNGASNAVLTVQQTGLAGPSTSYAFAGATAFYRWLTNTTASNVTLTPGQIVRLDTKFDTINVSHDFLLNGIWDYTCTQPHTIMVCALNPGDDPLTVGPTLAVSPRDTHVRGTFSSCNKTYNNSISFDTSSGIQQFPIAGNGDNYITGFDNAVTTPTAETDGGNYGVVYNIQLTCAANDGRALGLLLNPRAGAWNGAVNTDPGIFAGGSFIIPTGGGTISSNTVAALAAEYFPNSGKAIHLQFSPTGASSFPVRLIMVPFASPAPNLAALPNRTINVGQTVTVTASVTYTNGALPLVYSLPAAPTGATIGLTSGAFNWRAPVASARTTNTVQVRVGDSATPQLSDIQVFSITVNPLGTTTLSAAKVTNGLFQLQGSGPIGPDYILQGNTNLTSGTGWKNLASNTPTASPFVMTDTNAPAFQTRFYRLLLGP